MARLHPTREQGPAKKRRKVEQDEYIVINEVWGEQERTIQVKNKSTENGVQENKRRKKVWKAPQDHMVLTNIRTIENKVTYMDLRVTKCRGGDYNKAGN